MKLALSLEMRKYERSVTHPKKCVGISGSGWMDEN